MEISNKRCIQILKLLLKNKECMTGDNLAVAIGVSSRTIRNDMKDLNRALEDHGASVVSEIGQGYYLKIDDDFEFIVSDDLNMDSNKVKQVLNFLLERSLFDNTLFQSDKVLTSAGIQRRYQAMVKARALKNPITVERFWLLQEEETETFIKVNPSLNNSENNPDNSKKNNDNSEKNDIKGKERKGEYIYAAPPGTYFADSSLNEAFLLFLKVRQNNGDRLTDEQIQLLKEELSSMSDKPEELTAIVKKSVMSGWKTFYPLKKSRGKKTESKNSKNRFNNFQQREYDFNDYEKQLLNKGQEG